MRHFLWLALLLILLGPMAWAADSGAPPVVAPEPKTPHVENAALYKEWGLDPKRLPYHKGVDARAEVNAARARAKAGRHYLMVAFGANWCPDCRALHQNLHAEPARSFVKKNFEVANVDIGDFDRNLDLAKELGVDTQMGIPVAIFFDRDGSVIGTTNHGELEPSRTYTSRQILDFLINVSRNGTIAKPH